MREKYLELVRIYKETTGATFTLGYSMKNNKHYVVLINKHMTFRNEDPEILLEEVCDWIVNNRMKHPSDRTMYTINEKFPYDN